MAMRPPRACGHPMCREYTTTKGHCDKHQPVRAKSTNSEYIERTRLYSTARWKRVRRAVLMAEPLCRICIMDDMLTDSDTVDHIVPRSEGGADFDPNNLQAICRSCHSKKTNAEMSRSSRTIQRD